MTYQSKLSFTLKRFTRFLKVFSRSGRGMVGIVIIVIFIFLAFGGGILTPFSQKGEDPGCPNIPVGGRLTAPEWLRHIPPALGGRPDLSASMDIVDDPARPQLVEYGGEWNFTTTESVDGAITVENTTDENYPYTEDYLAVKFHRSNETQVYGKIRASLTKEFYYPYSGPPFVVTGYVSLLVNGTTGVKPLEEYVETENLYKGGPTTPYTYMLKHTPVKPDSEALFVIRMPAIQHAVDPALYHLNYTTGEIKVYRPLASNEIYTISYTYFSWPVRTVSELLIGDGSTKTFWLQDTPVKPDSEVIRYEGEDVPTSQYTIDYTTGEITLTFAPATNETIEISYENLLETAKALLSPVTVNVFIEQVGGERFDIWPPTGKAWHKNKWYPAGASKIGPPYVPKGFTVNGTVIDETTGEISGAVYIDRITAEEGIKGTLSEGLIMQNLLIQKRDNRMYIDWGSLIPWSTVFPSPGKYKYGMEIVFMDEEFSNESVETIVFIRHLSLGTYGTSFGLLGADHLGRDIFAQLIYGTRASLYVGLLSAIVGVSIGLVVGLAAGYLGKLVDEVLMRFADMLLILPFLPLLIVLVAILGASLENLILIMGFLGWMGFSRLVRSQVLSLRERPFVEAAKAVGAGKRHIITRHILPNVVSLVYVSLATSVPGAIVAEAALSWLGFVDPTRMSWGKMLHECQFVAKAINNWWWVIPPGLCIAALAVSFILLGFAIDDVLNPRLRVRR